MNVLGPLVLFKSTYQLLGKSTAIGKFIVVSSMAGSITEMSAMVTAPYGMSKAGVNWLVRKLQMEHPNLIVDGVWQVPPTPHGHQLPVLVAETL